MEGKPTTFWGKLELDGAGVPLRWHPLVDHCADVAAVCEALLSVSLWRQRITRVATLTDLDKVTRARLCVLCALHDLGKLTIPFQAKGRTDLGSVTGGHVEEAIAALSDPRVGACLAPLEIFGDGTFGLLVTSLAHHGQPRASGLHQVTRWQARGNLDPVAGLANLVAACRSWFPSAFEAGPSLPENAALEHAFAGLVTLADWLASDPAFYPFSQDTLNRMPFARDRAREIVERMSLSVPLEARRDATGREPFPRVSGYSPSPAQRAVTQLAEAPPGSITVLESETGSGKTEAALSHFVALFERGAVDGLYFALPTRTAATQIFRRVHHAVQRAFAQPPPVVLAVPGYIQVDDVEGQKLPGFDVLWPDADRFRYRGWAAEGPKRYLAGAVVVGTVDQVLLSSLMVSHAHMRATSLLRHLLVVDEVHASDDYMTRILEDVLARHARAGGHALLLSATLGAEARERLLQAKRPAPSLAAATATAYPLISHREVGASISAIAVDHSGRRREVEIKAEPELEDVTSVAARAVEAARRGAMVLVLKNTVVDCIETQRAVEAVAEPELLFTCAGVAAPHHGRFSRTDRGALDEALEVRIGKLRDRSQAGCVVVATQTVQQSLDIDVDLLITDLCPVDVLLQRIGRLHRHERSRPLGYETPRALVLVPQERDLSVLVGADGRGRHFHGLGSVYHDLRVLEATWTAIAEHPTWRIPEMSRQLVESGLHSEALDAVVQRCGAKFALHRTYLLGEWLGHRRMAELNLIDWQKPYSRTTFPSAVDERIKTRLGEGDRRVCFAQCLVGPFGIPVRELVIRASWARGLPADAEPTGVSAGAGAIRFSFGSKQFIYDRLGLRVDTGAAATTKETSDDDGP